MVWLDYSLGTLLPKGTVCEFNPISYGICCQLKAGVWVLTQNFILFQHFHQPNYSTTIWFVLLVCIIIQSFVPRHMLKKKEDMDGKLNGKQTPKPGDTSIEKQFILNISLMAGLNNCNKFVHCQSSNKKNILVVKQLN